MPMEAMDVTESSFEREVIEESRRRPVVVDFWAPWCGPCRFLGPVLEKLAREGGGAWRLAKVNTDENNALAGRFGIQGIPTVIAFRDGAAVSSFTGALPETAVRTWLTDLLPGPADALAREADDLLASGRVAEAEAKYREALESRPRHFAALVGLARVEGRRGRLDEAWRWLGLVAARDQERRAAELSRVKIEIRSASAGDEASLRARVEASPNDAAAHAALGHALAARGAWAEALEAYLAAVRHGGDAVREEARSAMLEVFEVVGPRSELADRYRSRLARELFK
jgi:putative thioredoxin